MSRLDFNDGTPTMDVTVLVNAESCTLVKDKRGYFYIVNNKKLKGKELKEDSNVNNLPDGD